MSTHNEGILVTGGEFHAVQAVAGRDARASIVGNVSQLREGGRDDVARALEELLDRLEREAPRLQSAGELVDTAKVVGEELAKKSPNKRTVGALLNAIGAGAGSVNSVVIAVKALASAAGITLGSLAAGGPF